MVSNSVRATATIITVNIATAIELTAVTLIISVITAVVITNAEANYFQFNHSKMKMMMSFLITKTSIKEKSLLLHYSCFHLQKANWMQYSSIYCLYIHLNLHK